MSGIRKIVIWFLLLTCLWLGGLNWFIRQIPQEQVDDSERADAIVVLTGGAGRLEYGLQLLAAGQAQQLFVSGVSEGVKSTDLLRKGTPAVRKLLEPEAGGIIAIGHHAENTIGNASETAAWLKKRHYHSILLVTASYHMPRSIEEFEEASPGLAIVPAPVFPDDFTLENWWRDDRSRLMILSEYHKFLAAKLRHWFVSVTHHS